MKSMKSFLVSFVLLSLTLCLAVSFTVVNKAAADETIKMNLSGIMPGGHLQAELNQLFSDMIAERTNGRVEITVYPGSTLTGATKNFEGVVKGISDLGMGCPLYTAGRFPVSELFEMPSEIDSGWVTAKVYMDLFNKFELKEFEDVHVLYLHGPGRNVLSTRTVPIRKLEDMKGLVLRSSGGASSTISALGATPRAMDMGEAYGALSKGVVEGQFAVPETLKGWKHADVVKYVSIPPVSTSSCQYVVMNKKKWNSLPPDIQKVFTEVSAEFPDYHGYVWNYYDRAGLEYFKSLPGRELIEIPADQRPQWQAAVAPVIEKFIKDKTAKGIPAKEILDYFNERIEYWSARQPSMEDSVQWVEKNLLKK